MAFLGDFIDSDTGELFENVRVQSVDEYERVRAYYRKLNEYEEKGWEIDARYKQYGEFVWLLYNINEALDWDISPTTLTRLIYLSTFMDYQNRLVSKSKNRIMTKRDMQEILILSDKTFARFYDEIIDSGILIENVKHYTLDMKKFAKGRQSFEDENRMRIYIDSVRRLYTKAKISEHKNLAYLYQTIPYVNIQYNILCFNPSEDNIDLIKPMTIKEFCSLIGYSVDNNRRLKTEMKKIELDGDFAFSFVENKEGIFIYINPRVFYAGNKWDKVEILGKFRRE